MKFFIDGAIMMSFCVAGLYFLRFWVRTSDRLFLMFAISFFIMAVNRIFLSGQMALGIGGDEHQTIHYLIRLSAFVLILLAIVDKNRTRRGRPMTVIYRDGAAAEP